MKVKLRSHPSAIFTENMFINFIIGVILINIIQNIESVDDLKYLVGKTIESIGLVALGVLGIAIISMIYSFIKWRVNYLEIDDQNISFVKSGIFKRDIKFTVNDIASINIKRNFLERIAGTSTIKIELNNSIKTIDEGIKFTFKKDLAEEIKENLSVSKGEEVKREKEEKIDCEESSLKILDAIIFSFIKSTSAINIFVGSITLGIVIFSNAEKKVNIFSEFIVIIVLLGKTIYDLIKDSIGYAKFYIHREGEDITVKHGFINIKEYSFNIDKVTGINIRYSILGRLLKRAYIEAIVVGLSNDANESAIVSLMVKSSEVDEYISNLFEGFNNEGEEFKEEYRGYILKAIKISILFAIIMMVSFKFGFLIYSIIVFLITLIVAFVSYKSNLVRLSEEIFSVKTGIFDKCEKRVKINKVQILKIKRGPIEKRMKLCRGEFSCIADFKDMNNFIPKLDASNYKKIKMKFN